MHSYSNQGPNFQKKCTCFDNDLDFFTRSFTKPKGRLQFFDKKDSEIFVRESRLKTKSWIPRTTSNADFYDPMHKANLCFFLYFNDSDGEQGELLKIRPMKLLYHLDDETISLNEPFVENSGLVQGRIFHRQRVPRDKDDVVGPNVVTWKDIKIGEDLVLFGRSYRVVSCDNFTKNFLQDRSVVVQDCEEIIPVDAWNMTRHFGRRFYAETQQLEHLQINEDADMHSWTSMPPIMSFHVAWLDTKNDFYGGRVKRTFRMVVNTHDDSVTLTETTPGFNDALFLRNVQLPYVTRDGQHRHFRAKHMRPGCWIEVYRRPMFIFDCEGELTKQFVQQQYNSRDDCGKCSIEMLEKGPPAEQIILRPAHLLFQAENSEFPKIDFLVVYEFNSQRLDICEANKQRKWTKARPFLMDVDASHLDAKKLHPGASLSLFRWNFVLKAAHPSTQKYLSSTVSPRSTSC